MTASSGCYYAVKSRVAKTEQAEHVVICRLFLDSMGKITRSQYFCFWSGIHAGFHLDDL